MLDLPLAGLTAEHVSTKPVGNLDKSLSLRLGSQQLSGYSFLPTSSASLLREKASLYRWSKGIWDPYNNGREALSLGRFPHKVEKEAKGGRLSLCSRTTPYDSSTKLL